MSTLIPVVKTRVLIQANLMSRIVKKYSGKIQGALFRQTLADKRRAMFGNDPFAA